MDPSPLVKDSVRLVQLLDEAGHPPKAAMVAHTRELDIWRLWIVPSDDLRDRNDFHRQIATIIGNNQADFAVLDPGDVQLREADHPAIKGMQRIVRAAGTNTISMGENYLNGFYMPSGVVIRMDT